MKSFFAWVDYAAVVGCIVMATYHGVTKKPIASDDAVVLFGLLGLNIFLRVDK